MKQTQMLRRQFLYRVCLVLLQNNFDHNRQPTLFFSYIFWQELRALQIKCQFSLLAGNPVSFFGCFLQWNLCMEFSLDKDLNSKLVPYEELVKYYVMLVL